MPVLPVAGRSRTEFGIQPAANLGAGLLHGQSLTPKHRGDRIMGLAHRAPAVIVRGGEGGVCRGGNFGDLPLGQHLVGEVTNRSVPGQRREQRRGPRNTGCVLEMSYEGCRGGMFARQSPHQGVEFLEQRDERVHAAHRERAVVVEVAELARTREGRCFPW